MYVSKNNNLWQIRYVLIIPYLKTKLKLKVHCVVIICIYWLDAHQDEGVNYCSEMTLWQSSVWQTPWDTSYTVQVNQHQPLGETVPRLAWQGAVGLSYCVCILCAEIGPHRSVVTVEKHNVLHPDIFIYSWDTAGSWFMYEGTVELGSLC